MNTKKMRVEFTTRSYVLSHGREPSARILGCWAFEFEDSPEAWFAPSTLTLAQAKNAARAEANRRAGPGGIHTTVKVLP